MHTHIHIHTHTHTSARTHIRDTHFITDMAITTERVHIPTALRTSSRM
jgi:hypothetical protein